MTDSRDKSRTRLPASRRRSSREWLRLSNPWIAGTLLVIFLAALLATLAFQFDGFAPELSEDDIGTIASQDVRATKDFTYARVDVEETERFRQERAREVPPIYRWDVGVAETSRRRIREAFAFMRAGIAQVEQREELATRGLLPPIDVRPPTPAFDTI